MKVFKSLRVLASQGSQVIADVRGAVPDGFRGRPVIGDAPCEDGCAQCRDACPTGAISLEPVAIDLGRCVFCSACEDACPTGKIAFTSDTHMGAVSRADLVLREGAGALPPIHASQDFAKLFGRSLKMRQVATGSCNGCELELNALANVNFDVQRFGIEWVASPRHADALVISGALTRNMKDALRLAWEAMPAPRFVVAVGACAISGGLYDGAAGLDRGFLESVGPALYVPGCPPHPLTFVNAILDFLGIEAPAAR